MNLSDHDSIKEYIKPVYNMIFRLTGKPEEAEDLTQETFLSSVGFQLSKEF